MSGAAHVRGGDAIPHANHNVGLLDENLSGKAHAFGASTVKPSAFAISLGAVRLLPEKSVAINSSARQAQRCALCPSVRESLVPATGLPAATTRPASSSRASSTVVGPAVISFIQLSSKGCGAANSQPCVSAISPPYGRCRWPATNEIASERRRRPVPGIPHLFYRRDQEFPPASPQSARYCLRSQHDGRDGP